MAEQPTYEALLAEVKRLRTENAELKKRLGIPDIPPKRQLSLQERLSLFMALFSGHQDVYVSRRHIIRHHWLKDNLVLTGQEARALDLRGKHPVNLKYAIKVRLENIKLREIGAWTKCHLSPN